MNNNNTPIISVLMPVYNVEKYVAEAIESVLNQTFSDFELILLDDCSADESAEIIKTFDDPRIVYHRNEKNLGLANNLNVGLKMARGKYIARADSDDICLPTRFETQVKFLENNPDIDLCSCGLEKFGNEQGVWIRESDPEQVKITMLFYSPVLHATSVWRRESFEKHGLVYDQNAFPAEDYDLWSRAVVYCKLANIPDVLYMYRIHGVQVTKLDDRTDARDRQIRLKYIKTALPEIDEKEIIRFLEISKNYTDRRKEDLKNLKLIIKAFIKENINVKFFNPEKFSTRMRRYYQSIVYAYLSDNPKEINNFGLLFDLRVKQLLKLMLKK